VTDDRPSFTCPKCDATSYHPKDVEFGYCGACHEFTGDSHPHRVPGWEGSIGPFPNQYSLPHVYARDVHSGAGNCVCGQPLGQRVHVQAAPGVLIPASMRTGKARPWDPESRESSP
jgi:hypothetical protein